MWQAFVAFVALEKSNQFAVKSFRRRRSVVLSFSTRCRFGGGVTHRTIERANDDPRACYYRMVFFSAFVANSTHVFRTGLSAHVERWLNACERAAFAFRLTDGFDFISRTSASNNEQIRDKFHAHCMQSGAKLTCFVSAMRWRMNSASMAQRIIRNAIRNTDRVCVRVLFGVRNESLCVFVIVSIMANLEGYLFARYWFKKNIKYYFYQPIDVWSSNTLWNKKLFKLGCYT